MTELWDILDAEGNPTGRLHPRGTPLPPGDYMLVVHVWKHNGRGKWLIDQRAPRGYSALDGKWETTGGCAIAGDTSLQAALRETREELGITLNVAKGQFFRRIRYDKTGENKDRCFFVDVWVFEHDCEIADLTLQASEVTQARWATPEEIRAMQAAGTFLNKGRQGDFYPYFEDMMAQFTPNK